MSENNKIGIIILGIVGIVAITGMVIAFMSRNFSTVPEDIVPEEVTIPEIPEEVGYRKACWSCYDGHNECQGVASSCKLEETWRQHAERFCEGHSGECVNSFEVYFECPEGFRKAHWFCYDGYEQWGGGETFCESSEFWQAYAEQSCEGHCQGTGIHNFSVMYECEYNG